MSAGAIRAGQAFIEIFAKDAAAVAALQRVEARMKSVADFSKKVGAGMMAVGVAAAGAIGASAKSFIAVGDQLEKMASRTQASVEWLSAMSYAAGQSGTSLEAVELSLRNMQRVMGASNSKAAVESLAELGLQYDTIKAMSPERQFSTIAQRLNAVENPARKTALAMELFGKSGNMMLPMLGSMEALTKQAVEMGLVMSTQDAVAAAQLGDAFDDMWLAIRSVGLAVGSALAEPLMNLAFLVRDAAVAVAEFSKENEISIRDVLAYGTAASVVGSVLSTIVRIAAPIALVLTKMWRAAVSGITLFRYAISVAGFGWTSFTALITGTTGAASLGALAAAFGYLAGAIAAVGAVAYVFYKIGEGLSSWAAQKTGLDKVFNAIYAIKELTEQSDVNNSIIATWKKQLDEGKISAEEFQSRLDALKNPKTVESLPADTAKNTGAAEVGNQEEAIALAEKRAKYEKDKARELEDAIIQSMQNEHVRALANIDAKFEREMEAAKEIGASTADIEETHRIQRLAETARWNTQRLEEEKKAQDELASLQSRFSSITASTLQSGLDREIAMIQNRYAEEIRQATGAADKISLLTQLQNAEISAARTRDTQSKDADKQRFDLENAQTLADLQLEAAYKGEELERKKLELARQRAILEAQAVGGNVDLINKVFDLKTAAIDADKAIREPQAVTSFSSRLAGMFGSAGNNRMENATVKTAKNTSRLLETMERFTVVGA